MNGVRLCEVVEVDQRPFGRGFLQVFTLACGHKVEHLGRRDLHVGSMTGCEECR